MAPALRRRAPVPELNSVGWVSTQIARTLLVKGQVPAVEAVVAHLGEESSDPEAARFRDLPAS